ncbi:MAG: TIM-barrel domain-containing protein, partial [Planctomycetota bacterium]
MPRMRSPKAAPALAIAALLALVGAPAGAQVHEGVAPGVVRSFKDASARQNAEASVAISNASITDLANSALLPAGFGPLPAFSFENGLETVRVVIDEPGVNLYATGFQSGPLERTGRRVEYYNLDNFGWGDFSNRNYQTHPWVLGVRADGTAFGVLFDSTWYSSLDTEDPTGNGIVFRTEGPSPRVVTINGATPQEVVSQLATITGMPFMPPMWSVGYHQSKYSYFPQSNVVATAQEFRDRQIPAEVIWMDIDYMDGFRNFSFNSSAFPNPAQLNSDLDGLGFQAVWMANCGQKVDGGWSVYQEMLAQKLAVKSPDRFNDFWGDVWPGTSVWPDYTMQATRDWWAGRIASFASIGIDGIWNDMNEPAVFNVPSKTMPDDNWHRADPELGGPGVHRKYHNIYGMQMSRATRDGMLQNEPNRRPFVLTRAGYIGGQRYAAMWTGDNVANWYHVGVSIQNILNIALSGQPNTGPDIGGFNGDNGGLHYARWMGVGAMMPFARGHYGFSSIDREPWSFGTDTEDTSRLALNRRYRLLNHFYTRFYLAHTTGQPVCQPLFFAEPDNPALREWYEGFLVGEGLLVVGVTKPGAVPQLPPMETPVYRFDFPQTADPASARDSLDPDLPDLYVLGGHIVPANGLVQHSRALSETRSEAIELIVALDEEGAASGRLYEDAGDGYEFETGAFTLYAFEATSFDGTLNIDIERMGGNLLPETRDWRVRVLTGDGGFVEQTFTGATGFFQMPLPSVTPDGQPDPSVLDGRQIAQHFGGRAIARNTDVRYNELSQLRALYAIADEGGLRVGIEGEMAIDGTAMALMIDAELGGQSQLRTPNGSPPAGLDPLEGTVLEDGFTPNHMLYLNAFDGNVFCDWVSLPQGTDGDKTYVGRQFMGSDSAA